MGKRFGRGVDLSPEHLALDLIHEVGPEGNYLTKEHTLKYFREEFWFPRLLDHGNYDVWLARGSESLAEKAQQTAKKILRDHSPEPLDPGVREKL